MRRQLRLEPGDQLVAEVEDDHSVRLTPRRVLAERDRGAFADLKTAESLVDELIGERRAEAAREDPDRKAEP
jgi:antitoxin component of MazEF toxin-antitoxin module